MAHVLYHNANDPARSALLGRDHSHLTDPTTPDPSTPHPDPIGLVDEIYALYMNNDSGSQVELNGKFYTLTYTTQEGRDKIELQAVDSNTITGYKNGSSSRTTRGYRLLVLAKEESSDMVETITFFNK